VACPEIGARAWSEAKWWLPHLLLMASLAAIISAYVWLAFLVNEAREETARLTKQLEQANVQILHLKELCALGPGSD